MSDQREPDERPAPRDESDGANDRGNLLRSVLRCLEGAGHALSASELARAALRTAPGPATDVGVRVLEPLLRGEARIAETDAGWVLRADAAPLPGALDGPFTALAVFPQTPDRPGTLWAALASDTHGVASTSLKTEDDLAGATLVVSARGGSDLAALGLPRDTEHCLSLTRLARALAGTPARASLEGIAARLGIVHTVAEGPEGAARLAAAVWLELRERLADEGLRRDDLPVLLDPALGGGAVQGRLDRVELDALPPEPGVYRFRDEDGRLLYVGKSVNLRARVASYFAGEPRDEKDRALRRDAASVEIETLGSEPEAILREHELIRRHRPALNRQRAVSDRAAHEDDGVLVLPGPTERRRTLLMLRGGELAERLTVGLRREGRERARRALLTAYFEDDGGEGARATKNKADDRPDRASDDIAREGGWLLASWLRRHPNRALWFDPTEAAGPDEATRLLERYLDADPHGGPLFLRTGPAPETDGS